MGIFDFLKPKWKHSNPEVRRASVEKIEDQQILYGLGVNDPDYSVRRAAIERLSDPHRLKAVVCGYGRDEDLHELAWNKLTDQSVLAEIVATAPLGGREDLWKRALGKITDQSVIPRIVAKLTKTTGSSFLEHSLREAREAVLGCAKDQSVISQIARDGLDLALKARVHTELGMNDCDEGTRGVDLSHLLPFLWEVAQRLNDQDTRNEIVERVYEEARRKEDAIAAIEALRRQKDRQRVDELKKSALQDLSRGNSNAARELVLKAGDWFDKIELIERLPIERITKEVLRTLSDHGYASHRELRDLEKRLEPLLRKMQAGGWVKSGGRPEYYPCKPCGGTGQLWRNLGSWLESDVDGPYQCGTCDGRGKVMTRTWTYSRGRKIVKMVFADGKLSVS